ncbi:hypothetical protein IT414_01990 [bacterium]|nr:hypothetical protein [bacterium]
MQPQVFHPDPDKKRDDAPPLNASTPVSQMRPNNLGRPRKPWGRIVVTLLVLVGLGVGGWYGYRWYQNNNKEKADLKSQVADLQKQNESLKSSVQPSPALSPVNDFFNISEFSIKFRPGTTLPDLTYIYDGKDDVKFSTRSLMAAAYKAPSELTACSPGDNPIGHIVRSTKQIEKAAGIIAVKKIDDKYYALESANNGPACSQNKGVSDLLLKQQKALESAFETLASSK